MKFHLTPYRSSVFFLILLGSCFTWTTACAQAPFSSLIDTYKSDGNKILQAYSNPFLKRHGDGWSDG